jgi:hypothetical protein
LIRNRIKRKKNLFSFETSTTDFSYKKTPHQQMFTQAAEYSVVEKYSSASFIDARVFQRIPHI